MQAETTNEPRGRWQLLALALVFFGPLLAAIGWYFLGDVETASVNYGELIDPPVSLDAKLHFDSGTRGRWTLLLKTDGRCDEICQQALVTVRQVRLATGREIDRIERAVLVVDSTQLADVVDQHPGLIVFDQDNTVGNEIQTAAAALPAPQIYIMDPLGNIMMRYPVDPDRKKMLTDIKKLLKFSRIG
ncbi:MAG: hypothetical protein AAFO81_01710 [Pseudomonadota bacterium]